MDERESLPYSCKPKAFAQRLHNAQVCILSYEGGGACVLSSKVNVGFIDDYDAFEIGIIKDGAHGAGWY